MNKQNVKKLELLLKGIEQRAAENYDYFQGISAVYKSGTKEFAAKVVPLDNKLKISFNGSSEVIETDMLSGRLAGYAGSYDAVAVEYDERGSSICIEADNKNVKMKSRENSAETPNPFGQEHYKGTAPAQAGGRDYLIRLGQADPLLKEMGILSRDGKLKNDMIRKYNQIDHFVELISGILEDMSQSCASITVIDCGCGKSYLTFVLNYYIKEVLKRPCHFIGLDSSEAVIEASQKMAGNLGYKNMEFIATDIRGYTSHRSIDLAISLHACDTATDEAMALAVNNGVKAMVMVPCCHKQLLGQYSYPPFKGILKHGILKARMADTLTEGMRMLLLEAAGYSTSIVEYISPLETPKNLMIRAQKTKKKNEQALKEYIELKKLLGVELTLEKLINL
ncbi:methyltransferase family protein [Anaerobacterium chartisolvens]|uniref:Methyltransferase family protein n=1 Tax=Anaerobacterium chartisolvens TaxID=1297424 RepID=A0A369BBG2_9FIRM|nr:SAM-dependent methyltransferase [Anaerobacterium chartisolvens]RCX18872.1 methyltransferase family protein [Anaerobacterium chartisolvens]